MAEAIGIISGLAAIATTVLSTSKTLYELIDGINNAPNDVRAISDDLKGL